MTREEDLRQRIEAVLHEHRYVSAKGYYECWCGFSLDGGTHDAHLADVLSSALANPIVIPDEVAEAASDWLKSDDRIWVIKVAAALNELRIDLNMGGFNVPTADEAVAMIQALQDK